MEGSQGGAAPSAPTSTPAATPAASPAAPPAGAQQQPSGPQPAPQRAPVPWKTKARIGDAEHEVEIDVDPFLRDYKRKVTFDGREVELGLDDAYRLHGLEQASFRRFREAGDAKKAAEREVGEMRGKIERLGAALGDPQRVVPMMRKTLAEKYIPTIAAELRSAVEDGDPAALQALTEIVTERVTYEKMAPDQRSVFDATRTRSREAERRAAELDARDRQIAAREKAIKERAERETEAESQRIQQQRIAEWVPKIEAAGLPAMTKGPDGQQVPNRRVIAWVADALVNAREAGHPITLERAIELAREEYEAMVGPALTRSRQQQSAAIDAQPGRGDAPNVEARPLPAAQPGSSEAYLRELRRSWNRG